MMQKLLLYLFAKGAPYVNIIIQIISLFPRACPQSQPSRGITSIRYRITLSEKNKASSASAQNIKRSQKSNPK